MSYQLAARDHDAFSDSLGLPAERTSAQDAFAAVKGSSPQIQEAVRVARRMATRGGANVLITGETGSGKEVFARSMHYAGPYPDAPFVAINCAAIPPALLESEMFGYEKGAFTDARQTKKGLLELAANGTLFLDEVSSLPLDLQPKLLRALEERRVRRVGGFEEIEIRCRVIAATNEPLHEMVAEGAFREDLFYRLNVLRVAIPPLRAREGDVRVLAEWFLAELAEGQGYARVHLADDALGTLARHTWPGNVRELKNVLERALVMSEGRTIHRRHLLLDRRELHGAHGAEGDAAGIIRIPQEGRSLQSVEKELVAVTLRLTEWNKSAAARILGISRPTLHRKIEEYDLYPATAAS